MAVDTKTTAAGAVVLLLSGGTSYAISNKVNGSSEEGTNQTQSRTGGSEIREKIKDSKFSLIDEQADKANQWTKLKIAIEKIEQSKYNGEKTEEKLKQFCQKSLEEAYSDSNEEKFKETIKKCTTLITLKKRAETLNIELIPETDPNSLFENRFNTITKDKVKELLNASSQMFDLKGGEATKENLKDFCKKVGDLDWTKIINKEVEVDTEWNNYLKGCAKEQNVDNNFWTGIKPSIEK